MGLQGLTYNQPEFFTSFVFSPSLNKSANKVDRHRLSYEIKKVKGTGKSQSRLFKGDIQQNLFAEDHKRRKFLHNGESICKSYN